MFKQQTPKIILLLAMWLGLLFPCLAHAATNSMASLGQQLVKFVHTTVDTLHYSAYELGGNHFDASEGIYILDCSSYVDHVLRKAHPRAYSSLALASASNKPTSLHYYDFFNELPKEPKRYWSKIKEVKQLQPGDILVFRNKKSSPAANAGGHVMVVMSKPVRATNAFLVRVADSAPTGHSNDSRPRHVSGIGIGTLPLQVNPKTGQPFAYAWKVGANWKRDVNFAMARPVSI